MITDQFVELCDNNASVFYYHHRKDIFLLNNYFLI